MARHTNPDFTHLAAGKKCTAGLRGSQVTRRRLLAGKPRRAQTCRLIKGRLVQCQLPAGLSSVIRFANANIQALDPPLKCIEEHLNTCKQHRYKLTVAPTVARGLIIAVYTSV